MIRIAVTVLLLSAGTAAAEELPYYDIDQICIRYAYYPDATGRRDDNPKLAIPTNGEREPWVSLRRECVEANQRWYNWLKTIMIWKHVNPEIGKQCASLASQPQIYPYYTLARCISGKFDSSLNAPMPSFHY